MADYVRFETPLASGSTRRGLGIFWAASQIEELPESPEWVLDELRRAFRWFNVHLPVPRRGTIDGRAVFWFDARSKLIREVWPLVAIVREGGISERMHSSRNPGRIVYRDNYQVAAIPFRTPPT